MGCCESGLNLKVDAEISRFLLACYTVVKPHSTSDMSVSCCFQDLTAVAAEQEEVVQEVDTSSMTLLELEQHLLGRVSGHGQRLALLQVLAIMCEGLPYTQLLRKPTQV